MKIKGRRQSSNVEVKKGAKQGRYLPEDKSVVSAPSLGKKAGVNSMKRAIYKRGRNP